METVRAVIITAEDTRRDLTCLGDPEPAQRADSLIVETKRHRHRFGQSQKNTNHGVFLFG